MQPILIIVLAAVAGVPLGLWMRRNLATLGYRNDDEADLPERGPRWWVVWTSSLALGSLAIAAILSPNPLNYLPLLSLAVTGPWLAAVDFDVLRIPNHVLLPTGLAALLAVIGIATARQDWRMLILPTAAALAAGGVFGAVHLATRGGIGFGDVKLAVVIGLAVVPLGAGVFWLSILTGSAVGLIWTKATRRIGPIPYGPWLLCGAWIASLASAATSG